MKALKQAVRWILDRIFERRLSIDCGTGFALHVHGLNLGDYGLVIVEGNVIAFTSADPYELFRKTCRVRGMTGDAQLEAFMLNRVLSHDEGAMRFLIEHHMMVSLEKLRGDPEAAARILKAQAEGLRCVEIRTPDGRSFGLEFTEPAMELHLD